MNPSSGPKPSGQSGQPIANKSHRIESTFGSKATFTMLLTVVILAVSLQYGNAQDDDYDPFGPLRRSDTTTVAPTPAPLSPCNDFYEWVCHNQTGHSDSNYHDRMFEQFYINFGRALSQAKEAQPEPPTFVHLIADLYFECIKQSLTNRSVTTKSCIRELEDDHIEVMLRIYVDYFSGGNRTHIDTVRNKAIEMAGLIKDAFQDMLTDRKHAWIDDESRAHVVQKLSFMRALIGYPDFIFEDSTLSIMYGTEAVNFSLPWNATSRLENMTQIPHEQLLTRKYAQSRELFRNQKAVGLDLLTHYLNFKQRQELYELKYWRDITALHIGSHYVPWWNFYHIPIHELHNPFFDIAYPAAVNLALQGRTIGHELAHGFTPGRDYIAQSGMGRQQVWTQQTDRSLNVRTACIAHQYSQLDLDSKNPHSHGAKVDGSKTRDENIADLAGMMAGFYALKKYLLKHNVSEPLLYEPEMLNQYSAEQLYFVIYAKQYCKKKHYRTALWYFNFLKNVESHAPAWHRVNQPLKNFPEFAQAFNCSLGSGMNPISDDEDDPKKCTVW